MVTYILSCPIWREGRSELPKGLGTYVASREYYLLVSFPTAKGCAKPYRG